MNDDYGIALAPGESVENVGDKVRLIRSGRGMPWGSEAYLLAAYIKHGRRALELGAGSGVISLLLASHGRFPHIDAVEIRADMADIAERNVVMNRMSDKVRVLCDDVRNITPEALGGRYSAVFANPPYIAHPGLESADQSRRDARHEIWGGIADFCSAASRCLNSHGSFYCVFRPSRLPDLFCAMRDVSLEPKRMTEIYPDAFSSPSAVLVEAKKDAAPSLELTPPLIIYREPSGVTPRVMTERAADIYETCSFY